MGRYQVCVGKVPAQNNNKPKLHVEVRGLRDPTSDQISKSVEEYVPLMAFDVTEPRARFIKVHTLANADATTGGVWEAHAVRSAQEEDEKSIQILHKRKSAGRVVSFSEATSTILNTSVRKEPSEVVGGETETLSLDTPKLRTLTIYVAEIQPAEKMTLNFDTENETFGSCTNSGVLDIAELDENGNSNAAEPVSVDIQPGASASGNGSAGAEEPIDDADDVLNASPWVTPDALPDSPVKIHVTVTNELMFTIELENNQDEWEETKKAERSGSEVKAESVSSVVASDVEFHLPYQNMFLESMKGVVGPVPFPTFPADRPEQREARKALLKRLVHHRLLALGAASTEAQNITDRWHSGYVQHRALSYRVPLVTRQAGANNQSADGSRPSPTILQLGTGPLDLHATFLQNCLRHLSVLKGTINSATATVLELEFFLMLPHFKTRTENSLTPHLPGAGINPCFIKDWVTVLQVAAQQLKPEEPVVVRHVVRKELKLLLKLLKRTEKAGGKMKRRLKDMTARVQMLKDKARRRLKPTLEWAEAIERRQEPQHYAGFSHLQMVGFSAPAIFQNHLYLQTAKFGLFLKRNIQEPWFPFSDLNFLERRVIFLGMTDHMYTSFDSGLVTIRHLEELFTPGYPMCLVSRLNVLFELLASHKPFQLLSPAHKTELYTGVCSVAAALQRFTYVHQELNKMIYDMRHGLANTEFTIDVAAGQKFATPRKTPVPKINLVVPFTTLNLEGFSNLAYRGVALGPLLEQPSDAKPRLSSARTSVQSKMNGGVTQILSQGTEQNR